VGHRPDHDHHPARVRPRCSSPSITAWRRVGSHAAPRATRFGSLEPLRQGVRRHFGGFARAIAGGSPPGTTAACSPWSPASSRNCVSSALRVHPPLSARWRAMAMPNASSTPSRKVSSGSEPSHRLGTPAGTAQVPRDLQLELADRTASNRSGQTVQCGPPGPAFKRSPGRIGCNPVCHRPRAVHRRARNSFSGGIEGRSLRA
jgi:hypothetical protein